MKPDLVTPHLLELLLPTMLCSHSPGHGVVEGSRLLRGDVGGRNLLLELLHLVLGL